MHCAMSKMESYSGLRQHWVSVGFTELRQTLHWPSSSVPVSRDHPTWTSWISMFLLEICFTGIFSVICTHRKALPLVSTDLTEPFRDLCKMWASLPYLHLKAGFAFVHTVCSLSPGPQVSKALHGERRGAVAVPRHLKVQVRVVWTGRKSTNWDMTLGQDGTHLYILRMEGLVS